MKRPYLKKDFRNLDPHEALELSKRLRAQALYMENGLPAGVRNLELLATSIEVGTHALVRLGREWVAERRAAQDKSPAPTGNDDGNQKIRPRQKS